MKYLLCFWLVVFRILHWFRILPLNRERGRKANRKVDKIPMGQGDKIEDT
jgi:hypothetical protein